MNDVLVLNADYNLMSVAPLHTISWKEAIKLSYLEQVNVIEYYENWYVHSPSVTLRVPSVVVSKTYVKTARSVKFNKANLCIRDDFKCQYCNKELDAKNLTMDHVHPKCLGGKTTWTNIVCSCKNCNTIKGHRTIMRPKHEPIKPTIGDIMSKVKKMPITIPDSSWIPYIGWNPKLITVKFNQNFDS